MLNKPKQFSTLLEGRNYTHYTSALRLYSYISKTSIRYDIVPIE